MSYSAQPFPFLIHVGLFIEMFFNPGSGSLEIPAGHTEGMS
jgi:hypothetical protein